MNVTVFGRGTARRTRGTQTKSEQENGNVVFE